MRAALGWLVVGMMASVAAGQVEAPPFDPASLFGGGSQVQLKAVPSHRTIGEADELIVALVAGIDDGWVLYSPDPIATDAYEPTAAELTVEAEGFEHVETLWPMHTYHPLVLADDDLSSYGYEDGLVVYVRLRPTDAAGKIAQTIRLTLSGQVCKDMCVPINQTAEVEVLRGDWDVPHTDWTERLAAGVDEGLTVEQLRATRAGAGRPLATMTAGGDYSVLGGLMLAILAGLILDVMPCVLPVIPIRILTIVDAAGDSRRRFVTLGLAFAGGVLAFFVGLAVVNVVAKLAFQTVLPWSSHFDYPAFRIGMALLLVALAVNLFGAFNVVVPRKVAGLDSKVTGSQAGHVRAAGMGLMLAVLATPCSFALLIAVLGWAQTQTLMIGTMAMVLVGAGMAAPHALLAAFPKLVDYLPRPGRWMELLKQGMGFAVLGVAVWLFGTLAGKDGGYATWVIGYGVVLAFALWMWGTWVRYDAPLGRKLILRGLAVVLAIGGGWFMLSPAAESPVHFEPFSKAALAEAREAGKPVLIKFSAAWCLSCKTVEREIYHQQDVADALAEAGIVVLSADVTDHNTPASNFLYKELGANGIPLTVLYTTEGDLIALPGKFSKDDLFAALKRATEP